MKCHITRVHTESRYQDREWLREKYESGLSSSEIAEEFDCDSETIRRWANKFGFGRSLSKASKVNYERGAIQSLNDAQPDPSFLTRKDNGYELAYCGVNKEQIRIHRLVAVAEYGVDAVSGMVVHHDNNIPWDNRPANLSVMNRADHTKHHHETEVGGFK